MAKSAKIVVGIGIVALIGSAAMLHGKIDHVFFCCRIVNGLRRPYP